MKTLRLEPLNDSDVETILGNRFDEGKVREFLAQAEAHSVTSLLYNPQTLGLLADVFELDGHWPETRLELFECACRLMVRESNKEHRLGETRRSADEFLRWAGRLCAVALISGRAGLSLNDMEDSQSHVPLGLFDEEGQSGASAALASQAVPGSRGRDFRTSPPPHCGIPGGEEPGYPYRRGPSPGSCAGAAFRRGWHGGHGVARAVGMAGSPFR